MKTKSTLRRVSKARKAKTKTISVVGVPDDYPDDTSSLPWQYSHKAFREWVHEVFLEGYKRKVPVPSLRNAINIVENWGYEVRKVE